MYSVYQAHFGLRGDPFNITPDPTFLYLSPSHKEALAQFCYGVKVRKGFMVLTGEVGTGKTTLIQAILNEQDAATKTALIFNTILNPQDLLRSICEEFGLVEPLGERKDFHEHVTLLNHFLLESYRNGDNCALIVDEAQNLSPEVLECIRLLSNFESVRDKLLQILLVGQPELGVRLNAPELRQLKQRVALRYHLSPLTFAEFRDYVAQRLEIAGGRPSIFAAKALEVVYAYSGGIPRLINVICGNGMLTAYALRKNIVDATMVKEVAADLHLSVLANEIIAAGDGAAMTKVKRGPIEVAKSGSFQLVNLVDVGDGSSVHMKQSLAERERIEGSAIGDHGRDEPLLDEAESGQTPCTLPKAGLVNVSPLFFELMIHALTDAMGPMAAVVVREQIAALGESSEAFPETRLAELVELVSLEILNESLRLRFMAAMFDQMRPLKAV